jgi:hypothetical protein
MRTVRRLRLRCFTFYEYLSRAVHACTCCPVESRSGPSKALSGSRLLSILFALQSLSTTTNAKVDNAYGGPGGIRTPVQNTFLFASYSNIFIYYTTTSIIDNTFFPPNPILNLRKVFVYISSSVVIILLSSSIGSVMLTLPGAVPLVTKSKAAPNSSM